MFGPIVVAGVTDISIDLVGMVVYLLNIGAMIYADRRWARVADGGLSVKALLAVLFLYYIFPMPFDAHVERYASFLPVSQGELAPATVAAGLLVAVTVVLVGFIAPPICYVDVTVASLRRPRELRAQYWLIFFSIGLLALGAVSYVKLRDVLDSSSFAFDQGVTRFQMSANLPPGYGRYGYFLRLSDLGALLIGFVAARLQMRWGWLIVLLTAFANAYFSSIQFGRLSLAIAFGAAYIGYYHRKSGPSLSLICSLVYVFLPALVGYTVLFRAGASEDAKYVLERVIGFDLNRFTPLRNLLSHWSLVINLDALGGDLLGWLRLFPLIGGVIPTTWQATYISYSSTMTGGESMHIIPGLAAGLVFSYGTVFGALAFIGSILLPVWLVRFSDFQSLSWRFVLVVNMLFMIRMGIAHSPDAGNYFLYYLIPTIVIVMPAIYYARFSGGLAMERSADSHPALTGPRDRSMRLKRRGAK